LGADYDFAATPGFEQGGVEYYSVAGAERMRESLAGFGSGTIVIGILGHPFKCPPAPFEAALLLHDHFLERGILDSVEIRTVGPMAAPVPITKELSQTFLDLLHERGIEYVPNQQIVQLDPATNTARLKDGGSISYGLFVGIPVHRAPEVVVRSGLAVDGWVPVERRNLATRFPDVYALGDITALPMAKAGVFAEAAARAVADDIAARLRGAELRRPYEGAATCYVELGGGTVGMIEANFFGGPTPTARLVGPSRELAADKAAFAATRRKRWFGSSPDTRL
jgi:sulfide:quinone oxidoreductase